VQAGWIKLSAGDDGITATEAKVLRAAARAARSTGAVIGSHTIRGRVVRDQLAIIEQAGYTHPSALSGSTPRPSPIFDLHLEMASAARGWSMTRSATRKRPAVYHWIRRLLEAGLEEQLLLSHDRGWYDPAQPGGGTPQPFTYLSLAFLPRLRAAGVPEKPSAA
jgi:phosphotriesterase-related protein